MSIMIKWMESAKIMDQDKAPIVIVILAVVVVVKTHIHTIHEEVGVNPKAIIIDNLKMHLEETAKGMDSNINKDKIRAYHFISWIWYLKL